MAPSDPDDFIASDAFGDFFFFGQASPSDKPSSCQSSPASRSSTGVFTFPVRSRATASNRQLHIASPVEARCSVAVDANADAAATLALLPTKPAAERDLKSGPNTNDVKATTASRMDAKSEGERGFGRSTSLDTADPHRTRDQSTAAADSPAASSPDDGGKTPCATFSQDSSFSYSQYVAARRSGSLGGTSSGGGAGPGAAPHHHHGNWHSTEWWRSFSSSRLNEMAAEEPDMRSPEMRKVPYVGGAEPMCAMVHGEEGKPQQEGAGAVPSNILVV